MRDTRFDASQVVMSAKVAGRQRDLPLVGASVKYWRRRRTTKVDPPPSVERARAAGSEMTGNASQGPVSGNHRCVRWLDRYCSKKFKASLPSENRTRGTHADSADRFARPGRKALPCGVGAGELVGCSFRKARHLCVWLGWCSSHMTPRSISRICACRPLKTIYQITDAVTAPMRSYDKRTPIYFSCGWLWTWPKGQSRGVLRHDHRLVFSTMS